MFLGSYTCKWLEPVGIMGRAVVDCPVLHRVGNHVRDRRVQLTAILDGLL